MRKTRILAAAALLTVGCLGTTGCDGDDTSTSGSGTSTTSTTTTNTGQGGQGGQGEGGGGGQGEGGSGGQGEGGSGGQGQGGSGGQGQGGQGGQGEGGGQGGSGGSAPACVTADDCPPSANECEVPACDAGMCVTTPAAAGTLVTAQTSGDCQRTVCDGNGGTSQENDDTDVADDGLDCTMDGCSMGTPTSVPAPLGAPCDDGGGTVCDGGGQCMPASCGNGIIETGETCDDGNTADGDGCDSNCTDTACGNGVVTAGEACDDGNNDDGDGCDSNCTDTACGNGILTAGEVCDDGNLVSGDGCDANCVPTGCGNGVVAGSEQCDDGNNTDGDGCDSNCTDTACGNGIVTTGEGCDDGALNDGDGCDASCSVEPGYTCSGAPSACAWTEERVCNDGADGDGDGLVDCADPDCAAGCGATFLGCGAGQALIVIPATGLPQPVPDVATTTSEIVVQSTPAVARVAVQLNVTHTWDADLDISLTPPGGSALDLSSDNGGSGQNYTGTLLDPACTALVTSGTAPFGGCYRPEANLGTLAGIYGKGTWTLSVTDDTTPDAGTLNGWSLVLCTAPITCGDGVVDAGEACDDGNTSNADACRNDCTAAACGDGIVQAAVGETCDDGNTSDNDCCSSSCQVNPSCVAETEPNNACGAANGPFTPNPSVTYNGAITPVGDQDLVAFTVPATANVKIETFSGGLNACTGSVDTVIQLRGTDCTTVLLSDDEDGINSCSKIDPATDAAARQLAPGTYYVRVEDYLNDGTIPAYLLQIQLTSLCGNGVLETFEQCDDGNLVDGDGCQANCKLPPACGNGTVDAGETCDDGNLNAGDGCSAVCATEPGYTCGGAPSLCGRTEVEVNNTFADADARANDPTPILITGDARFAGAITPTGDKDTFRIDLASAQTVRFETFDATGANCAGGMTTTLRLFSAAQTQLYTDTNLGISSCSSIVANLAAGTYYVQVEETGNNATVAAYQLEVKVQGGVGAETEPNETSAASNSLPGSNVFILGGHQANTDSDYFAITVPQGASIVAETIEGGAETCEGLGVDSRLTLYNSAGTQLVDDDDEGRGYCSKIDGSGTSPLDSGAHALAAGTYYLQVRASSLSQSGAAGQFDYKLVVAVRAP